MGETDLLFAADHDLGSVDVVFLCQGHGFSRKFWEETMMRVNPFTSSALHALFTSPYSPKSVFIRSKGES